jgi:hypothetical protein
MATEAGKPGTNWKQVSPENRKKVSGLVRHYMKKAHPFRACVRDNRKRFGDRAEKVCAVLKDLGKRSTGWRKGGKKVTEADVAALVVEAVEAAQERLDQIERTFGDGSSIELSEREPDGADDLLDQISAIAALDRALVEAWARPEEREGVLAEAEVAFLAPLGG